MYLTFVNTIFFQRLTDLGSSENSPHSHGPYFDVKSSSAQPVIQSMGKSTSLSTVNEAGDAAQADYKEIAALAHDMKNFADNLTKLKILFIEGLRKFCVCKFLRTDSSSYQSQQLSS